MSSLTVMPKALSRVMVWLPLMLLKVAVGLVMVTYSDWVLIVAVMLLAATVPTFFTSMFREKLSP